MTKKSTTDEKQKKTMTLIEAFDDVLKAAVGSELKNSKLKTCDKALVYINTVLGLTTIQSIVVAMLVDTGRALSWRQMASFVGVSRLNFMCYYDQVEELVTKRWLLHRAAHDRELGLSQGYGLAWGVVTALRKNEVFIPENLHCDNTQNLVDRLSTHINRFEQDHDGQFEYEEQWIQMLMKENEHLPLGKECGTMTNIHDIALLTLVVYDYNLYAGLEAEGLSSYTIDEKFPDDFDCGMPTPMRQELQEGEHELMRRGWIEHKCVGGLADTERFVLTSKAKKKLLGGFVPKRKRRNGINSNMAGLIPCKKITAKELFYNADENEQIDRLSALLSKNQFPQVQKRLESKGMRKGFACLLYGGPGTGKTATAYELARQTGRDIIAVSVTHFMDKYVGESEKKLREIFEDYRKVCDGKKNVPILLMNEADSIISTRIKNIRDSVDQMYNSLQNILLEEIETFEGILIATTNLNDNMDPAFERRFLFKIELHKPEVEARTKIWKSMIPELNDEDAKRLSKKYDFSGGEMENISRKSTVEFIIKGTAPTFEQLDHFCSEERLNSRKTMKPVMGFVV